MMANGVENYTSRYNDKYVLNSAPLRLRRNVRKWPTGLYCIVETDTYSVKDQVHFGISWQACVPSPKSKSKILNKQRNYVMWIVLFQRRDVFVKTRPVFPILQNAPNSIVLCFLSEHYSLGPRHCPIRRHRPAPSQSRTNPSLGSVLLTWVLEIDHQSRFAKTKGLQIITLH